MTQTRVKKRDGSFQSYDRAKIGRAMLMAFNAVQPGKIPDVAPLVQAVENNFTMDDSDTLDIESIQDVVELVLMDKHPEVAKAYVIYRHERAKARAALQELHPDPNALGDYIHPAKYARYIPSVMRRELYLETSLRSEMMHIQRWPHLQAEISAVWKFVEDQRVLPSMRSMQFGGAAIKQHNARMYNCSFSHANRTRFFGEAFYLLLCGCGVGFSVQWPHVEQLPELGVVNTSKVRHYVVQDNIEGWGDALSALFESHVDGYYVEFNYDRIRPEGSPLRTSGGKAPGHLPLKRMLERVRPILSAASGRRLRPIEVTDIVCHSAEAVLAGGIRRSSLIALFSVDDGEMTYFKAPENFRYASATDPGLNPHRAMVNISAVFLRDTVPAEQFQRIMAVNKRTHGEPGFFFTENLDYGTNPCGEIGLNPHLDTTDTPAYLVEATKTWGQVGWSFCNLCEINAGKFTSVRDFWEAAAAASFIGTLQAAYTDFPYLGPVTEAIVRREALLGVGIMGIHDTPTISLDPQVLRVAAGVVVDTNKKAAEMIGINSAARCTTVKPGGTAPKEVKPMVASGISYHHAPRYLQRVTANALEPVAQYFKSINPHMVEMKPNGDWCLVFPIEAPLHSITSKEATGMQLVSDIFTVYENWIKPGTANPDSSPGLTHNVSSTVVFREDEYADLLGRIWDNRDRVAAMAFFPHSSDKGIPFVPKESMDTPLDEKRWQYLIENYRPVDYSKMVELDDTTNVLGEVACAGGACDIDAVYGKGGDAGVLGAVVKCDGDFEGGQLMAWNGKSETWSPVEFKDLKQGEVFMRHDTGWVMRYAVATPVQRSRAGRLWCMVRREL